MKYILTLMLLLSSPAFAEGQYCKSTPYDSPNQGAEQAVVNLIETAQKQIHLEAYQITSKPILKALEKARSRGVIVQAVVDKTNKHRQLPFEFKIAPYKIFHNKVMLLDDKILITGSYNWTRNAAHFNAENFVILSECDTVLHYEKQFQKYWAESK